MLNTVGKVSNTIRSSKISDHWKEQVLPVYAVRLFKSSITLFALVCIALGPMLFVGALAAVAGYDFLAFLREISAIVASTGFAILYVLIRQRFL